MSRVNVDVGTPQRGFQRYVIAEVCFHGFRDLPAERGECTESPEFICLGHRWRLAIYPGGEEDPDDGMVAVYLRNRSDESIKINNFLSVKDSEGKEVGNDKPGDCNFTPGNFNPNGTVDGNDSWGRSDFAKRSKLVKALVNGTLTIEVRMRKYEQTNTPDAFIPENPLCNNILKSFMDVESADVVFEVGGEQSTGARKKRAKTTPTKFHAHRFILQKSSSTLAEMCGMGKGSVPIANIKPDIFRHMLYHLYGGKISDEDLRGNEKDLIDAADKYGVVSLKLEAEAFYVKSTTLAIDNIIDNLLYADSKNCALLKEAAVDFMVENGKDILDKVSFDDLPGSMVKDLLTAMTREKEAENESDDDSFNTMRVGTLRRKLYEKGLDVDGSREAMISLLKENS